MSKSTSYRQLQPEERVCLAAYRAQGMSVRESARRMGRSVSTVSRELVRAGVVEIYSSTMAQALKERRRIEGRPAPKLCSDGWLWHEVIRQLHERWSPEQIAATLKNLWPDDASRHVSHETIYKTIYAHAKGDLRKD